MAIKRLKSFNQCSASIIILDFSLFRSELFTSELLFTRASHENRASFVIQREGWIIAVVGTTLVRYEVSHYPDHVESK